MPAFVFLLVACSVLCVGVSASIHFTSHTRRYVTSADVASGTMLVAATSLTETIPFFASVLNTSTTRAYTPLQLVLPWPNPGAPPQQPVACAWVWDVATVCTVPLQCRASAVPTAAYYLAGRQMAQSKWSAAAIAGSVGGCTAGGTSALITITPASGVGTPVAVAAYAVYSRVTTFTSVLNDAATAIAGQAGLAAADIAILQFRQLTTTATGSPQPTVEYFWNTVGTASEADILVVGGANGSNTASAACFLHDVAGYTPLVLDAGDLSITDRYGLQCRGGVNHLLGPSTTVPADAQVECQASATCLGYFVVVDSSDFWTEGAVCFLAAIGGGGTVATDPTDSTRRRVAYIKPSKAQRTCTFHAGVSGTGSVFLAQSGFSTGTARVYDSGTLIATCGATKTFEAGQLGQNAQCGELFSCTSFRVYLDSVIKVEVDSLVESRGCNEAVMAIFSFSKIDETSVSRNSTDVVLPDALKSAVVARDFSGATSITTTVASILSFFVLNARRVILNVNQTKFFCESTEPCHLFTPVNLYQSASTLLQACGGPELFIESRGQTSLCTTGYYCALPSPLVPAASDTFFTGWVQVKLADLAAIVSTQLSATTSTCNSFAAYLKTSPYHSATEGATRKYEDMATGLALRSAVPNFAGDANTLFNAFLLVDRPFTDTTIASAKTLYRLDATLEVKVTHMPELDYIFDRLGKTSLMLSGPLLSVTLPNRSSFASVMDFFSDGSPGQVSFVVPVGANYATIRVAQTHFGESGGAVKYVFRTGKGATTRSGTCSLENGFHDGAPGSSQNCQHFISCFVGYFYDSNDDDTVGGTDRVTSLTLTVSEPPAWQEFYANCSHAFAATVDFEWSAVRSPTACDFLCRVDRTCIGLQHLCDQKRDCSDLSDEAKCLSYTQVEYGYVLYDTAAASYDATQYTLSPSVGYTSCLRYAFAAGTTAFAISSDRTLCLVFNTTAAQRFLAKPRQYAVANASFDVFAILTTTYDRCTSQVTCSGNGIVKETLLASNATQCQCLCNEGYSGSKCSTHVDMTAVGPVVLQFDRSTELIEANPVYIEAVLAKFSDLTTTISCSSFYRIRNFSTTFCSVSGEGAVEVQTNVAAAESLSAMRNALLTPDLRHFALSSAPFLLTRNCSVLYGDVLCSSINQSVAFIMVRAVLSAKVAAIYLNVTLINGTVAKHSCLEGDGKLVSTWRKSGCLRTQCALVLAGSHVTAIAVSIPSITEASAKADKCFEVVDVQTRDVEAIPVVNWDIGIHNQNGDYTSELTAGIILMFVAALFVAIGATAWLMDRWNVQDAVDLALATSFVPRDDFGSAADDTNAEEPVDRPTADATGPGAAVAAQTIGAPAVATTSQTIDAAVAALPAKATSGSPLFVSPLRLLLTTTFARMRLYTPVAAAPPPTSDPPDGNAVAPADGTADDDGAPAVATTSTASVEEMRVMNASETYPRPAQARSVPITPVPASTAVAAEEAEETEPAQRGTRSSSRVYTLPFGGRVHKLKGCARILGVAGMYLLTGGLFLVVMYSTSSSYSSQQQVVLERYRDASCHVSDFSAMPVSTGRLSVTAGRACSVMEVYGTSLVAVYVGGYCSTGYYGNETTRRVLVHLKSGRSLLACETSADETFYSGQCAPVAALFKLEIDSSYVSVFCGNIPDVNRRSVYLREQIPNATPVRSLYPLPLPQDYRQHWDNTSLVQGSVMQYKRLHNRKIETLSSHSVCRFESFAALGFAGDNNSRGLLVQLGSESFQEKNVSFVALTALETRYVDNEYAVPAVAAPFTPTDADYAKGFLYNGFNTPLMKTGDGAGAAASKYYGVRASYADIGNFMNADALTDDGEGFTISLYLRASAASQGFVYAVTDAFESVVDGSSPILKQIQGMIDNGSPDTDWYATTYNLYSGLYIDGGEKTLRLMYANAPVNAYGKAVPIHNQRVVSMTWSLTSINRLSLLNGAWHFVQIFLKAENSQTVAQLVIDGSTSTNSALWNKCVVRRPVAISVLSTKEKVTVSDETLEKVYEDGVLYAGHFNGGVARLEFTPQIKTLFELWRVATPAVRDANPFDATRLAVLGTFLLCAGVSFFFSLIFTSGKELLQSRREEFEANRQVGFHLYCRIWKSRPADAAGMPFAPMKWCHARGLLRTSVLMFVQFLEELHENFQNPHVELVRILHVLLRRKIENQPDLDLELPLPAAEEWDANLADLKALVQREKEKGSLGGLIFGSFADEDDPADIESLLRDAMELSTKQQERSQPPRDPRESSVSEKVALPASARGPKAAQGKNANNQEIAMLVLDQQQRRKQGGIVVKTNNLVFGGTTQMATQGSSQSQIMTSVADEMKQLLLPLLTAVQSISVWMTTTNIVPAEYSARFRETFSFFFIDWVALWSNLPPTTTPLMHFFTGIILTGGLFYLIYYDELNFAWHLGRYTVRRDEIDTEIQRESSGNRAAAPVGANAFAHILTKDVENPFGDDHTIQLFDVPLLSLGDSLTLDLFLGHAKANRQEEVAVAEAASVAVTDAVANAYALTRMEASEAALVQNAEIRMPVHVASETTDAGDLSVLGVCCVLHPQRRLSSQTQTDVWPYKNAPTCCVVTNGIKCDCSVGVVYHCSNLDFAGDGDGDDNEQKVMCGYALCEKHFRGSVKDFLLADLLAFTRNIHRNGVPWMLATLFLFIANSLYTPIIKTALMILGCHPYYQCTFNCWDNRDQKFTLAAFMSIVILLFYGLGYPLGLTLLLRRRSEMLHSCFFSPEYNGKYGTNSSTASLSEWNRFAATDPTALATLYNTFELRWLYVPPILLAWKVVLVIPPVFVESSSFEQSVGIAIVEFVYGVFIFFTEPAISPLVDAMYKIAATHQMIFLGLQAFESYYAYYGIASNVSWVMVASTACYLLFCVACIAYAKVSPAVKAMLLKKKMVALLATLQMQYSKSVRLYIVPSKTLCAAAMTISTSAREMTRRLSTVLHRSSTIEGPLAMGSHMGSLRRRATLERGMPDVTPLDIALITSISSGQDAYDPRPRTAACEADSVPDAAALRRHSAVAFLEHRPPAAPPPATLTAVEAFPSPPQALHAEELHEKADASSSAVGPRARQATEARRPIADEKVAAGPDAST